MALRESLMIPAHIVCCAVCGKPYIALPKAQDGRYTGEYQIEATCQHALEQDKRRIAGEYIENYFSRLTSFSSFRDQMIKKGGK